MCGPYGALWPQPTGRTSLGTKLIDINPNQISFQIFDDVPTETKIYLEAISDLLVDNLRKECHNNCTSSRNVASVLVRIYVNSYDTILTWSTDESYSLDITTDGMR